MSCGVRAPSAGKVLTLDSAATVARAGGAAGFALPEDDAAPPIGAASAELSDSRLDARGKTPTVSLFLFALECIRYFLAKC